MKLTKENVYVPIENAKQAEKAKGILEELGEDVGAHYYREDWGSRQDKLHFINNYYDWICVNSIDCIKTKITLKQLIEILVNGSIEIKEPLLISEDGVELFEGDYEYVPQLGGNEKYSHAMQLTVNKRKDYKSDNSVRFASKENAEKWVKEMNKPREIEV